MTCNLMLRINYGWILSFINNKKIRLTEFRELPQYRTDERRRWDPKLHVFRIHVLSVTAWNYTVGLRYHEVGSRKGWLLKGHLVLWPCPGLHGYGWLQRPSCILWNHMSMWVWPRADSWEVGSDYQRETDVSLRLTVLFQHQFVNGETGTKEGQRCSQAFLLVVELRPSPVSWCLVHTEYYSPP